MNWQTILLGIICLFTSGAAETVFSEVRDFNESQILGIWRQMYSNRFVQETEEVGWKCVSINVSQIDEGSNQLDIYKYALMNGNKSIPVSHRFRINQIPPTKDQIDGDRDTSIVPIIYMSDEVGQPTYILKDYDEQYNYLLWTKSDNASIYVWTRNAIEFKVNYDWKVLERFISWNYTGYYKFPLASYTFQCMDHRNIP